jgi:hypothetical protein
MIKLGVSYQERLIADLDKLKVILKCLRQKEIRVMIAVAHIDCRR